jgi:hypothetical protein
MLGTTCAAYETCPGSVTCGDAVTCDGSPTCAFSFTCENWPTCQPPPIEIPDLLKLVVDSVEIWPPHHWTAGDPLAAFEWEDWHWGPISPLLIWDEQSYPGIYPSIGEFVITEWWAPATPVIEIDSELVRMVYTVDVVDFRDTNADGLITPSDYILLHFTSPAVLNSQSCWYHVIQVGATEPRNSTNIIKLEARVPLFGVCACDCFADPDPACDGDCNVLDVVWAVNVAFRNYPPIIDPNPLCPFDDTDVDCDNKTDVLDVVRLVNVAFRNADPTVEFCDPCNP